MTDEILDGLSRTEHLLTAYLTSMDLGVTELEKIDDFEDLQMVTAGLLEFIAIQYRIQMAVLTAVGQPVDPADTIIAIHVGFMELRNLREQELADGAS